MGDFGRRRLVACISRRQFGIVAADERGEQPPCRQHVGERAGLFGLGFGKKRIGTEFAQRWIASGLDKQTCGSRQFLGAADIVPGEDGAVFGGLQLGMGDAHIACEIELRPGKSEKREITFGLGDRDPCTSLAPKLEALAQFQRGFGRPEISIGSSTPEIFDSDANFGIRPDTGLARAGFGSIGERLCLRNPRGLLGT